MIADVLVFLKNRLNTHFRTLSGSVEEADEDKVVFIDSDQKPDSVTFKQGAVTIFLFNIERDVTYRPADNYVRLASDGSKLNTNPDITVNLYLLFVAKFKDYAQSLHYLSMVLSYFQANPYLDRENSPELGATINSLVLELNTLTMSQQNELWGILRSSYSPSLVYKVKALTFMDDGKQSAAKIKEIVLAQKRV